MTSDFSAIVPNAPCGVESPREGQSLLVVREVPNAPCGVERFGEELPPEGDKAVPNAPCGVESFSLVLGFASISWFLMHRVELKASLLHVPSFIVCRS